MSAWWWILIGVVAIYLSIGVVFDLFLGFFGSRGHLVRILCWWAVFFLRG